MVKRDLSIQEIYDLAEQRINRRDRLRMFWAGDLTIMILALAAMIGINNATTNPVYGQWALVFFFAWGAIFTLHTIAFALGENRQSDIDTEAAKLLAAVESYEKPKRLALSDEGELVDTASMSQDELRRQKLSS